MQVDTALNLVWLTLGALALAGTLRGRRRASAEHKLRAPVRLHICGVALIAATLFPYISATDDVLRIQHMELQQNPSGHHDQSKKGTTDALIRLFEAMDTPVIGTVPQISLILFFISFVVVPAVLLASYVAPFHCGRSPPFAFSLTFPVPSTN